MNLLSRSIYITRLQKGLSQKELALKAGIPQPNLSGIEKGRDFKVSTLCHLAYALDVSVEDLVKGSRPLGIDKKRLFQRGNLEKAISCVVQKKEAPRKLKAVVRLISAISDDPKRSYARKRDAHLSWTNFKNTFSDEEISTILSRLNKARQRAL